MLYPYMTLSDGTEIVHSQVLEGNRVVVHFERSNDQEYCFATCELPNYTWKNIEGYSEQEIAFFNEFAQHNAHLIYDYAAKGGAASA